MSSSIKGSGEPFDKNLRKKSKSVKSLESPLNAGLTDIGQSKSDTIALSKDQQKNVNRRTKKIKKGLKDGTITIKSHIKERKKKTEESRGLIYIGHIPHGFYEEEMQNYFRQFGKVTNAKVCRSSVTGRSKGYGYVEFADTDVAKIAAEAMNNYVMFKKRIVTQFIPYEKRPKGLFHGKSSNLQFTSTKTRRGKQKHTRNKVQNEKLVTKKTNKTVRKLKSKISKLKDLGIQCSITPVHGPKPSSLDANLKEDFRRPQTRSAISKVVLTKSLDSVKNLVENLKKKDETTQTLKRGTKKLSKGGIVKVKKDKKRLKLLETGAAKAIARELVRTRGNPLYNLIKPKKGLSS